MSDSDNRYGVASLDQMDDDDTSSSKPSAAASASAAAATSSSTDAADAKPAVETYAHAVGVIEPPPDLKLIIDRTADFVRRVGPQFEGEIIQRNKGKKQFQFIENPQSPYHAYYKQRVQYGADGPPVSAMTPGEAALASAKAEAEAAKVKEAQLKAEAEQAAANLPPKPLTLAEKLQALVVASHAPNRERLAEAEQRLKEKQDAAAAALAEKNQTLGAAPAANTTSAAPKDAAFVFKVKQPKEYSMVDIDIIKLTALYLARSGLEFLHGLQRREARNPYFDFLKPQHPLFVFFQQLVESYKQILLPKREMKEALINKVRKQTSEEYLEQLLIDAIVKQKADEAAQKAKDREEAERSSAVAIDWKDFVVVETINFLDSEDDFLPAPRDTVEEMATMLASQQLQDLSNKEAQLEEEDMDVDMDVDEAKPSAASAQPARSEQDEVDRLIRSAVVIPDEEQLEIRAAEDDDMDTGAGLGASKNRAAVFQKCIVCGDEIAIDDLAEHMRIELLDPRWKEQKQALLDKQRESALASDSVVSVNLARLAKRVLGADNKEQDVRSEIKARKQALQDAILLYGPNSIQAKLAAEKAGEIIAPVEKKVEKPAPPAAAIGPSPVPTSLSSAAASAPRPPPPAAAAASPHIPPPPPSASSYAPGVPTGAPGTYPPSYPPRAAAPPPPPGLAAPGLAPPGLAGPPGLAPYSAYPPSRPPPPPGAYPGYPPGAPYAPMHSPPPPPGAMLPPGFASALHPAPAAADEDQPALKKQRTEGPSSSASTGDQVTFDVVVPNDASNAAFNFNGQTISITLSPNDTLAVLKERLSSSLKNMPGNKMKLQFSASSVGPAGTHLNKDDLTLAHYNVTNGAQLLLGVKERGGKKK